ncbi:MAG: hypothetical protein IJG38_07570 [Thermoguttaceae bacterium]|nr:hypothetical protein [Thermoguttaceae bacterium]
MTVGLPTGLEDFGLDNRFRFLAMNFAAYNITKPIFVKFLEVHTLTVTGVLIAVCYCLFQSS